MALRRWDDLSPRARRLVMVAGAAEGVLKLAALRDLRRRPAEDVRGSKTGWAVALTVVSSGGVLPAVYFLTGRRSG
jgi:hypothetical protein